MPGWVKQRRHQPAWLMVVAALSLSVAVRIPAAAQGSDLLFNTELVSMSLTGQTLLPMGENRSNVLTGITLLESEAAVSGGAAVASDLGGGTFNVDSFFDVFFDVTLTDIDPVSNFGGLPPDSSLPLIGLGPARVVSQHLAALDPNDPLLGLFPPPDVSPFVGISEFGVALGLDLDGNGENDKIKIQLHSLALSPHGTFIILPDQSIIYSTDATAVISGGVFDESTGDPPFGPLTLMGPTTAIIDIEQDAPVPEPSSLALLLGAVGAIGLRRARR